MARTQGHGNPNWTRDETILALDLYLASDGKIPGVNDERVQQLSLTLRSLAQKTGGTQLETFRNPAGVAFKIQNLRQVATGRGLGNVSTTDRRIWDELGLKQQEVQRLARLIKSAIDAPIEPEIDDTAEEFYEGRLLTRQHLFRERNPRIRKRLLATRMPGGFSCDICDQSFDYLPHLLREAAFEIHHIVPIAEIGERHARLADMALVCACCHRLIHRLIAQRGVWLSISDARAHICRST
ncbi:HNH endonuclease [Mesorhizobium sp.]|uniref:HNH endonuclease n=1 Tax=Mesorhizobium sp. TaxID=1871066 RepID=UPI00121F4AD4|nr:HNH endonuclease [Mesorhizobium sp.]TIL38589.1 MAG: HNH endonuclease [Mesorhizobium sp.]